MHCIGTFELVAKTSIDYNSKELLNLICFRQDFVCVFVLLIHFANI